MKCATLLLFGLLLSINLCSQSIERELISGGGTSFTSSTGTMSWSLGEPIIATHSSGIAQLLQGFQQPPSSTIALLESQLNLSITAYPNPTSGKVQLSGLSSEKETEVIVYNSLGQRLSRFTMEPLKNQFDIGELPDGLYVIQIQIQSYRENYLFKIEKTQ